MLNLDLKTFTAYFLSIQEACEVWINHKTKGNGLYIYYDIQFQQEKPIIIITYQDSTTLQYMKDQFDIGNIPLVQDENQIKLFKKFLEAQPTITN